MDVSKYLDCLSQWPTHIAPGLPTVGALVQGLDIFASDSKPIRAPGQAGSFRTTYRKLSEQYTNKLYPIASLFRSSR